MSIDPTTPVLVGIGVAEQREDDPAKAADAFELMSRAAVSAAADAGAPGLLAQVESIRVPRGFWRHPDPARLVADRLGLDRIHSVLAEIGVLQQTLISDACKAIAAGREEVSLVVGGEARYRELRAKIAGIELAEPASPDTVPDEVLAPKEPLFTDLELQRGLMMPVRAFATLDVAMRHHEGLSVDAHRDRIAQLWADMSRVAVQNPHAWVRTPVPFDAIRNEGEGNRMMAFPYSKLHCSDWNVDQAAALLFCAHGRARALGLDESSFVHPLAATESNHMVSLAARKSIHRSPGAAIAGRRLVELAGVPPGEIEHLELYSCFPAAVRVFLNELGLAADRPLTVTGGMAFAGGPLNNYVLQATARMAEVLRADRGARGLVTSVSGFHNKQGFALWSTRPARHGFAYEDCTARVAASDDSIAVELVGDYAGPVRIVGYTVVHQSGSATEGVAVCDLPDGRRTIGTTRDDRLLAAMTAEELCGREATVDAAGGLTLS